MGFNIAGIIVKENIESTSDLEKIFGQTFEYNKEVGFEEAASTHKTPNSIDVYSNKNGGFVTMGIESLIDLSSTEKDIVQFIVSDVSDTYYFEKHKNGELERKLITSEGEVAEDAGTGIINRDDEFLDVIWSLADDFLETNFTEVMSDLKFKHFELK